MIFAIATFLVTRLGVNSELALKIARWIFIGIIAVILFITVFIIFKACDGSTTIDEEQIQKINQANEKERKEELKKILVENEETIKTIDNRNISIEEKIREADKKIVEAKNNGRDVTSEELECILLENCQ